VIGDLQKSIKDIKNRDAIVSDAKGSDNKKIFQAQKWIKILEKRIQLIRKAKSREEIVAAVKGTKADFKKMSKQYKKAHEATKVIRLREMRNAQKAMVSRLRGIQENISIMQKQVATPKDKRNIWLIQENLLALVTQIRAIPLEAMLKLAKEGNLSDDLMAGASFSFQAARRCFNRSKEVLIDMMDAATMSQLMTNYAQTAGSETFFRETGEPVSKEKQGLLAQLLNDKAKKFSEALRTASKMMVTAERGMKVGFSM
jgi:hypothetical protein